MFRVAAAYAATAFLVLQGADLLASGLALPGWVFASLTVVAIAGFPLSVVLAWAYELTPAGVRRADPADGVALAPTVVRAGTRPWRWRVLGPAAAFALTLGLGGWWAARSLHAADDSLRALAVLPFESIAEDPDQAYFASGLRAEIMGQLSKMAELRLMSPAAVAAVADAPDRVARLATELAVGSVVEGSVRIVDRRARVSVQLTDARSGRTLWSEQYDRDLADVLAVQSDVALRVARALHARLSPQERAQVESLPTQNPVAYDLYLRAREGSGYTRDGLVSDAGVLRQALRLDPSFALAEAHLARRYMFLAYQGEPAALDSAHVIVRRAIATDSLVPYAWFTLGTVLGMDGRLDESVAAFERALAIEPNFGGAMNDLSVTLLLKGRFDESLYWAEQALSRAPNLANNFYHTGFPLLLLGDDAATERFLIEGLTRAPSGFHRVQITLATLELYTGRAEQAVARMAAEEALKPANFEVRQLHAEIAELASAPGADSLVEKLFHGHADSEGWLVPGTVRTRFAAVLLERGETQRAHRLLEIAADRALAWINEGAEHPGSRFELAAIHALRGDHETAIDWLRRAYETGYRDHRGTALNPLLAPLRDDPRFKGVLADMEADVTRMRQRAARRSDLL